MHAWTPTSPAGEVSPYMYNGSCPHEDDRYSHTRVSEWTYFVKQPSVLLFELINRNLTKQEELFIFFKHEMDADLPVTHHEESNIRVVGFWPDPWVSACMLPIWLESIVWMYP